MRNSFRYMLKQGAKGADQPVYTHTLVGPFVYCAFLFACFPFRCLGGFTDLATKNINYLCLTKLT